MTALHLACTPKNEERFCGFAVRFERGKIAFAATSRHLNSGPNGQLEQVILEPLLLYLSANFGKMPINRELVKVEARTSPVAVASAVGGAAVAGARMAMLGQLKKKTTLI
ncbi:MAG TPA: hypothetical protein VK636_13330 [Gemmatimonadaceae bacterium]|nr:hypothetical protein [Gemmatimonadaceae bacterium]